MEKQGFFFCKVVPFDQILINIVERMALVYKLSPAFRPKINVFLCNRGRWFRLWSWFVQYCSSLGVAFYHLLEYALGRPGRRGHVHLGQKFVLMFLRVIRVYEGFEVLRVFEHFSMVYLIIIWRNSNIFETKAVLKKSR